MLQLTSAASVKCALVFSALMATSAAHGSLLDCSASPQLELHPGIECTATESTANKAPGYKLRDATPATPISAALMAFQINPADPDSRSNSLPLLALFGALLAVLLVRAKRFNTK